jgi:DNA-binding PucR family transcriptional regulator
MLAVVDASSCTAQTVTDRLKELIHRFPHEAAVLSDPVPVEKLPDAYHSCLKLLTFAETGTVTATTTMLYPTVVALLPPDEMAMFVRRTWDRIANSKLQETLTTWLREGGDTGKVIRQLGIHRNTLANRLRQIEHAMDIKLSPSIMHQLMLARDWMDCVSLVPRAERR